MYRSNYLVGWNDWKTIRIRIPEKTREKLKEKTDSASLVSQVDRYRLFTTVERYLRSISDFLPSLSTHKHRERNLIKYQSLLAIRVWPMGMLDTRPQF